MSSQPTRESIEALLRKAPFSASNKVALESYVDAQAAGAAPYYMDANRSLLKLYQFSPQSSNPEKVALVLLLCLLEFPATDVLAARYLIPDKMQQMEPCSSIIKCSELLEACKFVEFWSAFRGILGSPRIKALLSQASTEKIQKAILGVLALSYRTASTSTVLAAVSMSEEDLSKMNHDAIESITGDKVIFKATSDNTKRNRVFQEGINYSSIASMMAKVSCE